MTLVLPARMFATASGGIVHEGRGFTGSVGGVPPPTGAWRSTAAHGRMARTSNRAGRRSGGDFASGNIANRRNGHFAFRDLCQSDKAVLASHAHEAPPEKFDIAVALRVPLRVFANVDIGSALWHLRYRFRR